LRKEVNNDCTVALGWRPEGKTSRSRPKTTWRRTVGKERETRLEQMDKSKTGSKQPPAVEGRCPGLVAPVAKKFNFSYHRQLL